MPGPRPSLHFIKIPGIVLFLIPSVLSAQKAAEIVFDFNDHTFNEKNNRVKPMPVGVTLVDDRFGNEKSALYVEGHANSYFMLGTSDVLKPRSGTLSLWVKLERKVYAGKGYESNPIFMTRRSADVDFYDACDLFYDFKSDRLMTFFSKDSTEQAGLNSLQHFIFNQWHHVVITYNDHMIAFYINGEKQGEAKKNFPTTFLRNSAVYIANGYSKKNVRTARGTIDDIMIFHRVLNDEEILELYHAPNPNKTWLLFTTIMKYVGLTVLVLLIAFLLVWQRRRALARVKEKMEANRRLHEMEIRILKAQMNPHFIFNSLNSIQQFIMTNDHEKAQEYLTKFSKLIRQQLESNVNESLSVQEEVAILNGYIEMELLRFGHTFEYNIHIDPRIDQASVCIPHLSVQPFVENAIWHGLLHKKGLRQLRVSFEWVSNKIICCTVDDNGVGRQAEKTATAHTFKKQSLALSLVRNRLELLSKTYQVDCGVEIRDKTNKNDEADGVLVSIRLPVLNQ